MVNSHESFLWLCVVVQHPCAAVFNAAVVNSSVHNKAISFSFLHNIRGSNLFHFGREQEPKRMPSYCWIDNLTLV